MEITINESLLPTHFFFNKLIINASSREKHRITGVLHLPCDKDKNGKEITNATPSETTATR